MPYTLTLFKIKKREYAGDLEIFSSNMIDNRRHELCLDIESVNENIFPGGHPI